VMGLSGESSGGGVGVHLRVCKQGGARAKAKKTETKPLGLSSDVQGFWV
jgi:hypothetical protein